MPDIDLAPLTPRAVDPLDNIVVVKESGPEEMGLVPASSFATAAQGALADSAVQPADLAALATDLTYTPATRVLASSTGTDATLPLMSSADAGLVPPSGGGTTNFLRADGTFAAPGGGGGATLITAAPASDQANWNPAGFGSGVGFIKLQPTTNSFLTGIVAGATDQFLTLFNDSDFVVCVEGESGASTAANRFRKRAKTMWLLPQESMTFRYSATAARWVLVEESKQLGLVDARGQLFAANQTTSIVTFGAPLSTTTATLSTIAALGTPTNEFTEHASTQVTNSTAAGTASIRGLIASWMRGASAGRQGFFHAGMVRFIALGATGAVRAGLSTTAGVSTVLNEAQVNCLLIGAQAANTTLRVYSGSAAAGVPIDLGANFPCPSATAAYEYCFYAPPNSAFVRYMVRRLDTRFVAEGSLTSNLPVNTTALLQRLEVMVGATAAANTAQAQYLYTQGL